MKKCKKCGAEFDGNHPGMCHECRGALGYEGPPIVVTKPVKKKVPDSPEEKKTP